MNQEWVWDNVARKWSEYKSTSLESVKKFLNGRKGRILDNGVGSGRNLIKNPAIKYYGVDFSKEMLKLAEEKAKKNNIKAVFFKSDLSKLPFSNNFFDYAIYISTLHCLTSPNKRRISLEELKRVMKPRAQALITVWNKSQKRFKKLRYAKEAYVIFNVDGKKYERYYYLYTTDRFLKLVKSVGFRIISINESKNIEVIVEKPEK